MVGKVILDSDPWAPLDSDIRPLWYPRWPVRPDELTMYAARWQWEAKGTDEILAQRLRTTRAYLSRLAVGGNGSYPGNAILHGYRQAIARADEILAERGISAPCPGSAVRLPDPFGPNDPNPRPLPCPRCGAATTSEVWPGYGVYVAPHPPASADEQRERLRETIETAGCDVWSDTY